MTHDVPVLASYGSQLRVAVFGASGGIGHALTELLGRCPGVSAVEALSRRAPRVAGRKIVHRSIDLEDEASIATAAKMIRADHGSLDIIIAASGILHHGDNVRPEKTWRAIDATAFAKVLAVNTIGPALVAKHFLPLLARDRKVAFAALSARVGSIGDNALGGWYSYRASKAALNMLIRTLSIELKRHNAQAVCIALHPGTVATPLSKPFQGGIPEDKLFTPANAAAALLRVVDARSPDDSCGFYAWDGQRLPY